MFQAFRSTRSTMLLLVMMLLTQVGWGQQIIGEFPSQDGGFEGQAGPFGTAASSTEWWRSAAGLTATLNSTGGRSGPKNTSLSISSMTHQTLRGPNVCNIAGSTNYTIQFYYKGDKVSTNSSYGNIRGAVSGNTYQYGAYQTNQNQSGWTKYSITTTSNPGASSAGFAVISIQESTSSNTATFDIDDVVIYAGSADNSVPNSAGAVSTSNATQTSLDVSWSAASGGVDGGGYVVVRYSTNPNADNDPNQNGIYAVGNTTTNGTGSLTGTIRYIGTGTSFTDNSGLSSGTTYYYKVYTVDKAFNYSAESSGAGTTTAASPSYTVTFDPNGGSGSMSNQVANTATNLSANTFTFAGYTFANWHTVAAGTGGISYSDGASFPFTANTTLYAQWTANALTVTYNSQGGSSISNGTTTTGGTISDPGTPTKAGFSFNGWFTASSGGSAISFPYTHGQTSNFTLYAQWTDLGPSINPIVLASALSTTYGTASTGVSFAVGGSNISSTLTATPQSGYEISSSLNGTYQSTEMSGITEGSTLYVRFASSTGAGSYNSVVAVILSGGGAASSANITTASTDNTVLKATPSILSSPTAGTITYGQTLASCSLTGGVGSVPGSFAFTTPSITPNAGTASQDVTFTPTDASNYNSISTTVSVTVDKANQSITFTSLPVKIIGDADFTLTATSTSGLAVSYSSSNPSVATISGSTVSILTSGTTTIIASQPGDGNYNAALNKIQILTVYAKVAKWTFENITAITTAQTGESPNISTTEAAEGVNKSGSVFSARHTSSLSEWTTQAGNGTSQSINSNRWSVDDYYQFQFSTIGYNRIHLNWDQTGSNSGPRNFKVQYSLDGSTYTDATGDNSSVVLTNDGWSTSAANYKSISNRDLDLSSVTSLNNKSIVYIRIVCNSTTSISGSSVATTGTSSVDNIAIIGLAAEAGVGLPVSLLSFSGYKDGFRNQLRWVTSSETNNSGFQVERSSDGLTYQAIGFVQSLAIGGNSQTQIKYNFVDANPTGIKQYYRLKQMDIDGRSSLSNILLIQGEKPTGFEIASVFPNPSRGQVTMLLSAPSNETVSIRLMDLAGRILETRQVNVLAGNNSIPFDLSKQAKGQYLITVGEKTVRVVRE